MNNENFICYHCNTPLQNRIILKNKKIICSICGADIGQLSTFQIKKMNNDTEDEIATVPKYKYFKFFAKLLVSFGYIILIIYLLVSLSSIMQGLERANMNDIYKGATELASGLIIFCFPLIFGYTLYAIFDIADNINILAQLHIKNFDNIVSDENL